MSHRILITGASGYLGGTLLARWHTIALPKYDKLFALVRTEDQGRAVSQLYGAEPLQFDAKDEAAVRDAIVSNKITIVFFLIDAATAVSQVLFIKALAEVKQATGIDVHFLHVS
jgi:N-acetyl-gamma-glutamylphosphate reductase